MVGWVRLLGDETPWGSPGFVSVIIVSVLFVLCLLYTSDAADEEDS